MQTPRIINSPGVQINEVDLTNNASLQAGTNVLIMGFGSNGPTNEPIDILSKQELNDVFFGGYGPTNASERYFYHTCYEALNSPANVKAIRLPYGAGAGDGGNGVYTVLAYPGELSAGSTVPSMTGDVTLSASSALYLGAPTQFEISSADFEELSQGQITWTALASSLTTSADIEGAALIVVNTSQFTVNEFNEGYYLAVTDNAHLTDNVTSGYSSVEAIKATSIQSLSSYSTIPTTSLNFELTGSTNDNSSMSYYVESTGINYDDPAVCVYLTKIRKDITSQTPDNLIHVPVEKYIGSLYENDKRIDDVTKSLASFSLEDSVNEGSSYIKVFVNSNVASRQDIKKVFTTDNSMLSLGQYKTTTASDALNSVGTIPTKIERALLTVDNILNVDIDIVLDGGLSTMWAYTADTELVFDDEMSTTTLLANGVLTDEAKDNWFAIYSKFNTFCSTDRKDCVYIADPLRCIFLQGRDTKVMEKKGAIFTTDIINPLKKNYEGVNTNYGMSYANWVKKFDNNLSKNIWLPFSGFQAAIMANTDATVFPWGAPFGLNRGVLQTVTDIAIRPTQKQCDVLYKMSLNPVVYFNGDGFVVWGQKTLQTKPSAFDRINVRRCFLALERPTWKAARYFIAEPNTAFTRTRVVNTLTPVFEVAKNNQGVYDYRIICNEKNNTAEVIDNNEMRIDIYLKPVRTAEFILCTFYATKTSLNFSELGV